jgi:ABC-type branched-subunit amino acid transport system ATPase component
MSLERALVLENVTVVAGGQRILSRVSFPVWSGMTLGLIGPNGAGKTTVFNAICGEQKIVSGRITLFGRDVSGKAPLELARAGVGRLFQDVRVFGALTALENVLVGTRDGDHRSHPFVLGSAGPPRVRAEACRWLERLGIEGLAMRKAGELSSGQQKRVAIARLMAARPRLLLLDEPTTGLDPGSRSEFLAMLKGVLDESAVTALIIEHDLEAIKALADWTAGIGDGQIQFVGRTDHMLGDRTVQGWLSGLWGA